MRTLENLIIYLFEQDEYLDNANNKDYVLNEPSRVKIPYKELKLKRNKGYHNILTVFKKATKEEVDYWSKWYKYANRHVENLAQEYEIPVSVSAAVCAVLSPGLTWKLNVMSAKRIMDNWAHENNQEDYPYWKKIPAYRVNINKAMEILKTGDLSIVRGPKVSVFYESLLEPDKVSRELVLDGHAINVWRGMKVPISNLKSPTIAERKLIIRDYRKVAKKLGLSPQAVQAVTWYIWKAVKQPPKIKGKVPVDQEALAA